MSWKQILEAKQIADKQAAARILGDPCCETAREKLIDLVFEHGIVVSKHGREYSQEETISKVRKEPCKKIHDYLLNIQNNFFRTRPKVAKEAKEILDEWEECDSIE
tara:strand:- start:13 stop:330 length:318 start_codon:yes stop_codon:yes gene_type:complete